MHDKIAGKNGAYKDMMQGLKNLKKFENNVEVKMILMEENYNEIDSVIKFCDDNNYTFTYSPILMRGKSGNSEPLAYRMKKENLKKILKYDKQRLLGNNDDDFVCEAMRYSIFIDCNGNVFPCESIKQSFGNILKTPFKNIVNNNFEYMKLKSMKWIDLKECSFCKERRFCIKCPGITYDEYNDYCKKSSIACQMAVIRHKEMKGGEKNEEIYKARNKKRREEKQGTYC